MALLPAACLYAEFLALPFYENNNKPPVTPITLACAMAHAMVYQH